MASANNATHYENDVFLKDSYAFDKETGRIVIEILLEKPLYLFNEWDNAGISQKDLDPDLIYFLEECFDEIPFNYELQLNIAINERERDPQREKLIASGFVRQFRRYLRLSERKLRELYHRAALYVLVSAIFLLAAALLSTSMNLEPVGQALLQGLYVGGWVFLWEAISEISFSRGRAALMHKIRAYTRFLRAPIVFSTVAQSARENQTSAK